MRRLSFVRSGWKMGWVSNNLNNFTIASAFARRSRNKLCPCNLKIDDHATDTQASVRTQDGIENGCQNDSLSARFQRAFNVARISERLSLLGV